MSSLHGLIRLRPMTSQQAAHSRTHPPWLSREFASENSTMSRGGPSCQWEIITELISVVGRKGRMPTPSLPPYISPQPVLCLASVP